MLFFNSSTNKKEEKEVGGCYFRDIGHYHALDGMMEAKA